MRKTTTIASVALYTAFLCGCGESVEAQRNRATSQVNVLAESLSEKIGEDGWFVRATDVSEVDPWGNTLTVKYERKGARETLTVRSNGQDGLPLTKDDIASRYHLDSDKSREARSKELNKKVEGFANSLSRGLTKGVVDVVKEAAK